MAAAYLGSTMETQTTALNTIAYFFVHFYHFSAEHKMHTKPQSQLDVLNTTMSMTQ